MIILVRFGFAALLIGGVIFLGYLFADRLNLPAHVTGEAPSSFPAASSPLTTTTSSSPSISLSSGPTTTVQAKEKRQWPREKKQPRAIISPTVLPKINIPKPPLPSIPVVPPSASSSLIAAPSSLSVPVVIPSAPRSIDPQSIVGLNCYFKNKTTGTLVNVAKGSGVIIDPRGYVLTSRHLVDLHFAAGIDSRFSSFADVYTFDYCALGNVVSGTTLPSPELIASFNPSIQLPVLGYAANLLYVPTNVSVSPEEGDQLDFAVLKIYDVSADGPNFGVTSLPPLFPFTRLASADELPQRGEEVLTYGFPGDVTSGMKGSFNTLYLTGGIGHVIEIFGGNSHFQNVPLVINTRMSVTGGRSGSPLIFRGLVAGIISSYRSGNTADSFSVSATAIAEFLPDELNNQP